LKDIVTLNARSDVTHYATLCTICTRLNCVEPQQSHNTDVKGMPSVDDQYLRNDTRQTQGYFRPLIASDVANCTVPLLMTLSDLEGHFKLYKRLYCPYLKNTVYTSVAPQ